jgi:hypothetical protein
MIERVCNGVQRAARCRRRESRRPGLKIARELANPIDKGQPLGREYALISAIPGTFFTLPSGAARFAE